MQTQTEFHTNDCPHAPQCSPDNNGPCWQAFKAVCGMGVGMMANVAMGGAPFEMNMNMTTTSSHYNNGASVSVSVPTPAVSVNIPAPGFQVNMSIPAVQVAVPVIQFSAPLPFPVQPYAGNKSFVEIFLDKPYYLAGETVQGRCELSVHQHISHAHSLMIKWKGFERTLVEVFVNKQENGQNVRERQKFKENKEFFSSALTLFNFGGSGVPPGKYTFPFSYKLPANLPGVFYDAHEEVDGEKIRAAIVYKVKCWLDMKGKDIKKDYKIVISEPVTKQITAVHEENKKSFLLARGECKLKVDLQKNVFVPGESIPVKVLVENESSKKVDALKVKLMRTVKVKAQQHKKDHISEVSRMKYDGVDKKTNKDTVLNFVLDNKVFPSTSGSLVECRYHLDIECDVAMAADLEITIALLPAAGQPVLLYQNYAPRAW